MADYTAIQNANLEPGAPWISATAFALRDNPIAIAEGAAGAPRIQNAAMTNGTLGAEKLQSGATERDWVLARCAVASVGAVGTYAILRPSTGGSFNDPGETRAGSGLLYGAGLRRIEGTGGDSGIVSSESSESPAGTWRCMGATNVSTSGSISAQFDATLWLRIS